FNIATHASLDIGLNALAGFTRRDTERAVDELLTARSDLATSPGLTDRSELLRVLEEHYNGYRFSPKAIERVFNSDMVLYFLSGIAKRHDCTDTMLDHTVRTE